MKKLRKATRHAQSDIADGKACSKWTYLAFLCLGFAQLEWVTISFSRRSSRPRDWTQVSHIVGKTLYRLSHQGSPYIEGYRAGVGRLWPVSQIQPTVCFSKWNFIGLHLCSFNIILLMAALVLFDSILIITDCNTPQI